MYTHEHVGFNIKDTSYGELLFNGYRVSALPDKKCSEDVLHSNVNVLNVTELHTSKS